jgi:hypothetical protein
MRAVQAGSAVVACCMCCFVTACMRIFSTVGTVEVEHVIVARWGGMALCAALQQRITTCGQLALLAQQQRPGFSMRWLWPEGQRQ